MADAANPDTALRVLLALRLKSLAAAPVVADAAGIASDDIDGVLASFAEREWVRFREGKLTGWMLTPAGRAEGGTLLRDALDALPEASIDAVRRAYQRFLANNQRLLELCTDWQLKGGASSQELNDHSDAGYDAPVIARLRSFDAEMQPVFADLAAVLPRFGGYADRFGAALAKVEAGDVDFFTKPMLGSYHTVWFELHENLLATLGIERSTEPTLNPPPEPTS